ncbi:MAG: sterol desaturase family protein [Hyphococcus sp.]
MAMHAAFLPEKAVGVLAALGESYAGLFSAGSRFFPPYIIAAVLIAALAYWLNRRKREAPSQKGVLSYLFDKSVLLHPSALVDVKIALANRLWTPFITLAGKGATIATAGAVAAALTGQTALTGISEGPEHGLTVLAALTLTVMLASDFTTYWVHRLHHEHPALWPLHRLHHSAETLTPVTVARKHPLYDLIRALANAFLLGPVQGVIFALFGVDSMMTILGVNAAYAAFHWTGSNLRHSHVWFSYGPVMSHVLMSPAQHQIHHSRAPAHHDKNYGEVFSLWDWMFGTLYVPKGFEELSFGLADAGGRKIEQPHPTLWAAWTEPVQASLQALRDSKPSTRKSAPPLT